MLAKKEHPLYNTLTNDNGLWIIKLANHLTFSQTIDAIKLPEPSWELLANDVLRVSGWGRTTDGSFPNQLQWINITIMSLDSCKEAYNNLRFVTDHMICARDQGKDWCQGDSGGPLSGGGYIFGVVSWGYGCGIYRYPVFMQK